MLDHMLTTIHLLWAWSSGLFLALKIEVRKSNQAKLSPVGMFGPLTLHND